MLSLLLTQTKEYELYFLKLYKPKNKNSRGQGSKQFLVSSVMLVATSNIKQAGSQQGAGNETRGASD